eukprot:816800-Prymnesium_polylepis.1
MVLRRPGRVALERPSAEPNVAFGAGKDNSSNEEARSGCPARPAMCVWWRHTHLQLLLLVVLLPAELLVVLLLHLGGIGGLQAAELYLLHANLLAKLEVDEPLIARLSTLADDDADVAGHPVDEVRQVDIEVAFAHLVQIPTARWQVDDFALRAAAVDQCHVVLPDAFCAVARLGDLHLEDVVAPLHQLLLELAYPRWPVPPLELDVHGWLALKRVLELCRQY